MNNDFQIKEVPLKDLHANKGQVEGLPKNPRIIKDARFKKLVKSLKDTPEMLRLREVIAYDNDGELVVICGNQRLAAAKDAGLKALPTKILPASTSVEKLREYTIKDNVAFGEDDWEALSADWKVEELESWGMLIPSSFNLNEALESDIIEDDFNDLSTKTFVKKGEIWQLGKHRLMCGDCTEKEDIDKLIGGEEADMWITDPPYNVNYEGSTADKLTIKNDHLSDELFSELLKKSFSNAFDALKPGGSFYIWYGGSESLNFFKAIKDAGQLVRSILIWNKNVAVLNRQDYHPKHEPCMYGWKADGNHKWYSDHKQTTVLDFDKPQKNDLHPTMKPVALFAYLIKNSSAVGNLVLDTFCGSGTSIIACEQLGRRCYAMELDEHYCSVIIERWQTLTGQKAECLNSRKDER